MPPYKYSLSLLSFQISNYCLLPGWSPVIMPQPTFGVTHHPMLYVFDGDFCSDAHLSFVTRFLCHTVSMELHYLELILSSLLSWCLSHPVHRSRFRFQTKAGNSLMYHILKMSYMGGRRCRRRKGKEETVGKEERNKEGNE